MARLLGEAYIAILPETSQFGPQARAQLDKDIAAIHPQANVGAQLSKGDIAKIATQLKSITKSNPVNVAVNLDKTSAARMVAQLDAYTKAHTVDVGTRLDMRQLAKIQGTIDSFLKGTTADVALQLNPAQLAKVQGTYDAFVKELNSEKISPDFNALPMLSKIVMLKTANASLTDFIQAQNARNNVSLNIMPALAQIATVKAAEAGLEGNKGGTLNIGSDASALANTSSLISRITSALVGLSKVEDDNSDAVSRSVGGYGLWGRAINVLQAKIPLFGGALTALRFPDVIAQASGWHILGEAVAETIAVWGPATIAMATFALASIQDAKQVVGQWQTVQTVIKATGQPIAGLTSGLSKLSLAIRPEIWTAFGEGLIAIEGNSTKLEAPLQSIGHLFDVLGSHIDQLVQSGGGGFAKFVQGGANDIHELGEAFGNVGKILAVFFQSVPGYATILLHLGTDFLGAAASTLAFLQPLLKVGLAVHGAIFYLGLASTLLLGFGKSALIAGVASAATGEKVEASGSRIANWGTAVGNLAGVAVNAGKKVFTFGSAFLEASKGATLATKAGALFSIGLDALPFGPEAALAVGLAAAIGVGLFFAFRKTADAASILGTKLVALVQGSNPATLFINTQHAIEGAGQALEAQISSWDKTKAAMGEVVAGGYAGTKMFKEQAQTIYDTGPDFSNFIANFGRIVTAAKPAAQNQLAVAKAAGSMANAINIAANIGIKWSDINKANASQLKTIIGEIQGYTKAVDFMGNAEGQAASNVSALNIVASQQYTNVQKVNSAWSALLTLIGGGENAFISLQQGLNTLNTDLKTTGASMTGLNPASLTLRADFQSVAQAAESQISALTSIVAVSSGATTAQRNLAEKGIKAVVSELIPYAGANKVAQAEVVQLAQRANNSLTTWQAVVKWVGKQGAAGAANTLQNANFLLASSIKNVTAVANGLTGAMNGLVAAAQDKLLLALNHGIAKMGAFGQALAENKGKLTQQTEQLGVSYYDSLVKSGLGAQQASGYVLSLAKSLGVNNAGLEKLTADMAAAQAAQNKTSQQTKNLTGDVKNNTTAFEGLVSKLDLSKQAAQQLFTTLAQQDIQMVSGKATTAKAAFVDFAENGLKLTAAQANDLWNTNKAQNLVSLAGKADTTKSSFIALAKQGLGLTTQQAQQLWNTLRLQYLDTLVQKGDNAKQHFIDLAKSGLGLTTSAANTLWNTLRNQYLDTLANKANETRAQFVKTAQQFGLTKQAADQLWTSLRGLAGGSPYSLKVLETLSGQGSISATVSASGVKIGDAGGQAATVAQKVAAAATSGKLAAGGIVPPGSAPAGRDGYHAILAPGELVVPASHAPAFHDMARKAGIPQLAGGGLVGNTGAFSSNAQAVATAAQQGVPTIENAALQFTKLAMAAFAGDLSNAAEVAGAAGGDFNGSVPGGFGNLLTIAKYLLANGLNRGAAAGIAATIDGECVTLDSMILTKRGWLKHDEVVPGDETIGYNPATGKSEWTHVTRVMHYDQKPVVTYGNKYWQATFTPNHRWLTETAVRVSDRTGPTLTSCPECGFAEHRSEQGLRSHMGRVHRTPRRKQDDREVWQAPQLTRWDEFTGAERIILSREADTGSGLPISDQEAALLGWVAGDGSVMADGRMFVYQSKPQHFEAIEASIGAGNFTLTERDRRGKPAAGFGTANLVERIWYVRSGVSRDLIQRAGNPKTDAFAQVISMSPSQRHAWLEAVIAAEGSVSATNTVIYQNEGNIAEAIELAVYLEGHRPAHNSTSRGALAIGLTVPTIGGPKRKSFTEDAGCADVWCVTTELGSWTARNDSGMFLTGNSTGNPESINCVPLTYKVVTERGILSHDEVRVGDRVPAWSHRFNRITTAVVLDVPYHYDAKICRIGNASWSVTCTHDHKWITEEGLVRADRMPLGTKILLGDGWSEPIEYFTDLGRDDTFCLTTTTGTWTTIADDDERPVWTGNSSGFGLIGWTGNTVGLPPGYTHRTGNVQYDMAQQLKGVIGYMNARGGRGPLNAAGNISPVDAGDVWSSYEAPAVHDSDTRPAVANEIYAMLGGASAATVKKAVQTQKQVAGKVNQVKPHSAGGMVSEPVYGFGANSGIPYSFAESGPEMVSPGMDTSGGGPGMPGSTAYGQQQTNQLLQQVLTALTQLPYGLAKVQQNGLAAGMRRGAFNTGG